MENFLKFSQPRLRNSFALDFFIVIKRFNVRLDPLSFGVIDGSLIPVLLPDDGIGEPIKFVPVIVVDEWLPIWPCWRGLNGECGRRQPFDHAGGGKLFLVVGEWSGVFIETFAPLIGDDFAVVPVNDNAD